MCPQRSRGAPRPASRVGGLPRAYLDAQEMRWILLCLFPLLSALSLSCSSILRSHPRATVAAVQASRGHRCHLVEPDVQDVALVFFDLSANEHEQKSSEPMGSASSSTSCRGTSSMDSSSSRRPRGSRAVLPGPCELLPVSPPSFSLFLLHPRPCARALSSAMAAALLAVELVPLCSVALRAPGDPREP